MLLEALASGKKKVLTGTEGYHRKSPNPFSANDQTQRSCLIQSGVAFEKREGSF
jgi:hypothetical protein